MDLELPKPIHAYFAADKEQASGPLSQCFAEDAVVRDEGQIYTGRSAIRRWKADASQKYTYTVEPFSIVREGDRTVVTSHLVGDFPGSPVDLRYLFVLDGETIASLEIIP